MQATHLASMETQDESLRRRAAEINDVRRFLNGIESPYAGVKLRVFLEAGREKAYMTDLPDFQGHTIAVPYGRFNLQLTKMRRRRRRCSARLNTSHSKMRRKRWPLLKRKLERITGTSRSPFWMPARTSSCFKGSDRKSTRLN